MRIRDEGERKGIAQGNNSKDAICVSTGNGSFKLKKRVDKVEK